jgi:hypothetical protein
VALVISATDVPLVEGPFYLIMRRKGCEDAIPSSVC